MFEDMQKRMESQMKQVQEQMAEAKKQQEQMVAEVKEATAPALAALKRSETFKEGSSEASKDPRVEMWELVMKKTVVTNEAMQDELSALFDKYDSNHNGALEKDELKHTLADSRQARDLARQETAAPTCPAPENRFVQGKKVSPKLILC